MPDNTVTVSLSAGQTAIFANLSKQEEDARKTLDVVPIARNAAAMAVVLQTYTLEQIAGQQLQVDHEAQTITLTLNGLALVNGEVA